MYEKCDCFKFHDVTLLLYLYLYIIYILFVFIYYLYIIICIFILFAFVFTFASSYHQTASFFISGGHFSREKVNDFKVVGKCGMLLANFHAGARKPISDLWPLLLKQPIKIVLIF